MEHMSGLSEYPFVRVYNMQHSTRTHTHTHINHTHTLARTHTQAHTNTRMHIHTRFLSLVFSPPLSRTVSHAHAKCMVLQNVVPRVHQTRLSTHCKTLNQPVTHCTTLQHTATHRNTLQHTATPCNTLQRAAAPSNTLYHTAIHCSAL